MFRFSRSDFSISVDINCIFLSFHIVFSFVYQLIQKKIFKKKGTYVEQATKRMKDFKILSNELQILMLPLADDTITVWGALTNLLPPLCSD